MTRNLKLFVLCAGLWSVLHLAFLYGILRGTKTPSATLVSLFVAFTVVLSSLEEFFKGRDDQRAVRYNLPLRYSVVAASASCVLAAGWILAWRQSPWLVVALGAASVLVVVGIAAWSTRNRIKAFSKDDLFR